jgi:hypothetical protein
MNVDYLVEGGGRVSWELSEDFAAQHDGPLEFQLQVGRTANPLATDWEAVGATAFDTWFMIDDQKRIFGKTQWTHYRVCLRTDDGQTFFSMPVSALFGLNRRDWRIAKELARQERQRLRIAGQEGYLLKRKVLGQKCTTCRDHQTDEIRDPDCPTCYGTGFLVGYFDPIPCVFADLQPMGRHEELDGGQARGTINDIVVQARMLGAPHMNEEDVWVARRSDMRWYIHRIQNISEIKGVPIVVNAELRLAPFSELIYEINIPGQVQ